MLGWLVVAAVVLFCVVGWISETLHARKVRQMARHRIVPRRSHDRMA